MACKEIQICYPDLIPNLAMRPEIGFIPVRLSSKGDLFLWKEGINQPCSISHTLKQKQKEEHIFANSSF
jgi:hypothetical protein